MMGLSLDMLADMQAAAANDSDYARLFELNYGEVNTDEELESSCKNLQMRRFTEITAMHDRLSAEQPAGFPTTSYLFPVLLPIVHRVPPSVDPPPEKISDKVMVALKIELGLLTANGLSILYMSCTSTWSCSDLTQQHHRFGDLCTPQGGRPLV